MYQYIFCNYLNKPTVCHDNTLSAVAFGIFYDEKIAGILHQAVDVQGKHVLFLKAKNGLGDSNLM